MPAPAGRARPAHGICVKVESVIAILRADLCYGLFHRLPEEQAIAKIRSQYCDDGFDLHAYPVGGPSPTGWRWHLPIACMTPRSRGEVHLSGPSPKALPLIDHQFLSDPEGYDAKILADGIRIMRDLAATEPLRSFVGDEFDPRPSDRILVPSCSCRPGGSSAPPDSELAR